METLTDVAIAIKSPAFDRGGRIPARYTYEEINTNPPLEIGHLPSETRSLALIMEDVDAPAEPCTHWVVWNIDPIMQVINEHTKPGVEGKNSFDTHNYVGPKIVNLGHRYYFRIYALNRLLNLDTNSNRENLLEAIEGNVLAFGELVGRS